MHDFVISQLGALVLGNPSLTFSRHVVIVLSGCDLVLLLPNSAAADLGFFSFQISPTCFGRKRPNSPIFRTEIGSTPNIILIILNPLLIIYWDSECVQYIYTLCKQCTIQPMVAIHVILIRTIYLSVMRIRVCKNIHNISSDVVFTPKIFLRNSTLPKLNSLSRISA